MHSEKYLSSLAKKITKSRSKTAVIIGNLLVDESLRHDFFKAYAYFRWIDEVVDESTISDEERIHFIERQEILLKNLSEESLAPLCQEEELIIALINNSNKNTGLKSYIQNMFEIIKFDAYRKGRFITKDDLTWYSDCLGKAVVDGLQYFIGNGFPYFESGNRYLAAIAAHITHLLRDTIPDISNGYINIPREFMKTENINDLDINSIKPWVKKRVDLARKYFQEGKEYISKIKVRRCQIAAYLYCAQFEKILNTIENDNYCLRSNYAEEIGFFDFVRAIIMIMKSPQSYS